jgi:uncharacterized membrane protein YccF (DUF307 family)
MSTSFYVGSRNPGCLLQVLWFFLVGIWLAPIWVTIAWVLMLTIVGIPFGVAMLNRLPLILALRDPSEMQVRARQIGKGVYVYEQAGVEQYPILVRAIYFVLFGWWLSALWMLLAYLICCTIIGLPLGVWMFDLVPALISLKR